MIEDFFEAVDDFFGLVDFRDCFDCFGVWFLDFDLVDVSMYALTLSAVSFSVMAFPATTELKFLLF